MSTIRIEIHNSAASGTYVNVVGGENWQDEARAFIKDTAASIRAFDKSVKVWALMIRSGDKLANMRRIEA
jgi:hypothetical protein